MSKKTITIIIDIEGGLPQSILSTDPNVRIVFNDRDVEGAQLEEVLDKEELKEVFRDETFYEMSHEYYISNENTAEMYDKIERGEE